MELNSRAGERFWKSVKVVRGSNATVGERAVGGSSVCSAACSVVTGTVVESVSTSRSRTAVFDLENGSLFLSSSATSWIAGMQSEAEHTATSDIMAVMFEKEAGGVFAAASSTRSGAGRRTTVEDIA